ncbi:hypothetical protein [Microbacterium schleiferi]|uniref:hypothetical protein n=1 Tax=Microbacterium schleiferi TaxID=69362 RepID=UPI001D174854|nr:hypothetical protein [Microbacterium schleiferi]MCC4267334.1 hypothetical protein [Microbacterium schleiferi]
MSCGRPTPTFADVVAAMKDVAIKVTNDIANAVDKGRRARIEADLDRKQEQLRRTVLDLANALGMEAHETRRALIRESYLASGKVPTNESADS